MKITMIPCVDAGDFPKEVEDWCDDHDIPTHCATELHCVDDDGNPLAEYLKENGYEFKSGTDWIGVWGT